jgi:CheY-like chemotaxis protein
MLRRLARKVLETKGYSVLEAADGLEALHLSETCEGSIDLLLTDVVMPKASGRETAERLVARRPGLRVLYASGYAENVLLSEGRLTEKVAFLEKPYTPDDLARKVREVLDH